MAHNEARLATAGSLSKTSKATYGIADRIYHLLGIWCRMPVYFKIRKRKKKIKSE